MADSKPAEPLLRIRDLSKSFAATQALAGVGLEVNAGEVHGLLGQNGSGKSTLVKILAGVHAPDEGTIELAGEPLELPIPPAQSRKLGIGFVHQDLALVDSMSIVDNLRTDGFDTGFGNRIRWGREQRAAAEQLREFGVDRSPRTPVGELSGEERAIVALVRALHEIRHVEHGVLILDEPTVYLPRQGVERLFEAIRATAARGSAVILVTHRFDEVYAVCDRLTVLRDGHKIGTEEVGNLSEEGLIRMILGQELAELEAVEHEHGTAPILTAKEIHGRTCRGVSLEVCEGEVVGVTGLAEAGADELAELLVGAGGWSGGELAVDGSAISEPNPRLMKSHGIVLLPADRLSKSGIAELTIQENVSLPVLSRFFKRGRLRGSSERRSVSGLLQQFNVQPPRPQDLLGTLSGGNQQKALLAKWLQMGPRVLILHEPTQGVDVGSRRDVFLNIQEVAAAGTGVVIVSTEAEDLAALCDRVLILHDGRIASTIQGSDVTEPNIVQETYAVSGDRGSASSPES